MMTWQWGVAIAIPSFFVGVLFYWFMSGDDISDRSTRALNQDYFDRVFVEHKIDVIKALVKLEGHDNAHILERIRFVVEDQLPKI